MDEKSNNMVQYTKESSKAFIKSMLSTFPVVGSLIDEFLFEVGPRVRQERYNMFLSSFIEFVEETGGIARYQDKILCEEFVDIFDAIMMRVIRTNSEEKINRFQKILREQLTESIDNEFAESFLDTVSRLNEDQIMILDRYRKFKRQEIKVQDNLMGKNMIDANVDIRLSDLRKPESFGLSKGTYYFYIQDMISKSLMKDIGMNVLGVEALEMLEITEYGDSFLSFIEAKQ